MKRKLNFKHIITGLFKPVSEYSRNNKIFFWFLLVIFISTALKFIFVFKYTDFRGYLSSDMGGYWTRAYERYNGNIFDINQWAIWPPLFHIILSFIFKVNDLVGIFIYNLEVILSINIILSSLSIIYLYLVTEKLSGSKMISFITATLYAFTYYTFYFNAFILSENFAVPLAIASVYYLIVNKPGHYFVSGILLAVATGIRPGFGILALPFGFYALLSGSKSLKTDWVKTVFFKGVWKAALFSAGFVLIILFIIAENNHISGGKIKGLAASGGINKYFSFTKTYEVQSRFEGYYYVIIPPGTVRNPENGKLITNEPIYNTAYFNDLTKEYIQQHPGIFFTKIKDLKTLYFGVLFPSMNSVLWFNTLREPFRWLAFILSLAAIFSLFITKNRHEWKNYILLLSIIFFSLLTCYLFNSEHRYLYGFMFAVYPIALETLFKLFSNFRSYRKKLLIFVSVILMPVLANAGYKEYKRWEMEEKITTAIYPEQASSNPEPFNVDELNFPFNKNLAHKTLGYICSNKNFNARFEGRFETSDSGLTELFVYCEEVFELKIDDNTILSRSYRNDEKETSYILNLSEGIHTFELSYSHSADMDAGIKAMYSPLFADDVQKYYFGEDSTPVKFMKLSSTPE